MIIRKTRLSHPDLHPTQETSEISRLKVDIRATDETSSRSLTISTKSSPGGQRGPRFSQPNLPSLYSYDRRQTESRRYRMSQPSLYHSSLSGLEGTRFSFSSLSEEDKTSDRSVLPETPQATPRVRKMSNRLEFTLRTSVIGKRERLSQPTLLVGDTHPKAHQRLSQPTLGYASREYPACLQSPLFKKKRSSQTSNIYLSPKSPIAITKRDKMSQLDVGAARFQHLKNKYNRDRFSIPELETQNDLKLIAGTPKQRFSLDSQLNPKTGRCKSKLLPIASSPESELQKKLHGLEQPNLPMRGFENILIASTTPILPNENNLFKDVFNFKPSFLTSGSEGTRKRGMSTPGFAGVAPLNRERMSVPEIRNSSLRRLLDPPVAKQRHSITGGTPRQQSLAEKNIVESGDV